MISLNWLRADPFLGTFLALSLATSLYTMMQDNGWYAQPLMLLVLMLLVLILLVLMLLVLVLLALMGLAKMCFLVKSSGASPVPFMYDVRSTVFDRLPFKKSTCYV